jgi:hypothetical protein
MEVILHRETLSAERMEMSVAPIGGGHNVSILIDLFDVMMTGFPF